MQLVFLATAASLAGFAPSSTCGGVALAHVAATRPTSSSSSPLHVTMMGGFEQKQYNRGGARLALQISGAASSMTPQAIADICREDGRTGVVYELSNDRMEVVAEGEKDALEGLLAAIKADAGSSAQLKENWQLPVGSYASTFPVVDMTSETSTAQIKLSGEAETLDYFARHVQIEAVFNRGLKLLSKERARPTQLDVQVKGASGRVKSFVRWCYNGPPMARAEEVSVEWQ